MKDDRVQCCQKSLQQIVFVQYCYRNIFNILHIINDVKPCTLIHLYNRPLIVDIIIIRHYILLALYIGSDLDLLL